MYTPSENLLVQALVKVLVNIEHRSHSVRSGLYQPISVYGTLHYSVSHPSDRTVLTGLGICLVYLAKISACQAIRWLDVASKAKIAPKFKRHG